MRFDVSRILLRLFDNVIVRITLLLIITFEEESKLFRSRIKKMIFHIDFFDSFQDVIDKINVASTFKFQLN